MPTFGETNLKNATQARCKNMSLFRRMSEIVSSNSHFEKDLSKSVGATKFIGRGSNASSTNKYMLAAGDLANCGSYTDSDIVFVSAEGARRGRKSINAAELQLAVDAGAAFITDNSYDRNRPYNVGEREVAAFLTERGYSDDGIGIWENTKGAK